MFVCLCNGSRKAVDELQEGAFRRIKKRLMLFEEVFRSASTSSSGVGGRLNGNAVCRVEATLR